MQPAPFHLDIAEGPDSVQAVWLDAADGVRLRVALWPEGGDRGTVLMFPGRTEYVEKYGRTAADLAARGFAMAAIDWRGQGLADRALDDRNTGHVMHFTDYQMDVGALLHAVRERGLPEPWYLLGHSMGGAIGLRALYNRLPVVAAAFTAPMWGIAISGFMRPIAWSLSWSARYLRLGHVYTPGTKPESYASASPFDDNVLTADPDMFAYMQRHLAEHPELALGGPSLHWLYEALRETRNMAHMASPDLPVLTMLGGNERVVDTAPIAARMANWPGGRFEVFDGAQHEVLMEKPEVRQRAYTLLEQTFAAPDTD